MKNTILPFPSCLQNFDFKLSFLGLIMLLFTNDALGQLPSGVTFNNYQLSTNITEAENTLPTSWNANMGSSNDIDDFDQNYQNYPSLIWVNDPTTQGWSQQTALITSLYTVDGASAANPDIESYKNTIKGLVIGETYVYSVEAAYNNIADSSIPQGRVPYLEVTFGGVSGGVYLLTSTAAVYDFTFTATADSVEIIINDNVTNDPEFTGVIGDIEDRTNPQVMVLAGSGVFEIAACDAGPLPPSTETHRAIPCGQSTLDLSGIVTDRPPSGTTISFHSGAPATEDNELADASALMAGTYYIAHRNEKDGVPCYSPTSEIIVFPSVNCSVTPAPCGETIADGTHAGTVGSGTITSSVGNATYTITKVSATGYTATEDYAIDSESGVKVTNNPIINGGDSFTYTYAVTPNDADVVPQIRFYQARGQGVGNNEASIYTISWVGGDGNAVYYDNTGANCSIYTATSYPYTSSCPAGFDINNREIVGLSTTGEIPNGGAFHTYMINNNSTEWYVEFPKGATSVTVTKTVNTGGNVGGSGCGQSSEIPSCGIDSQLPYYGMNLGAPNSSGESFTEWISFNTKLIQSQCATITGSVYYDVNNLTDNTVNGDGISDPSGVPLYANLLDASGNVVASVPVSAAGSYTFTNITPANGYTVQVSTTSETPGTSNPTPNLPAGWVNTGENIGAGAGSDGTINGISAPINLVAGQTQSEVNFGISDVGTISGKVEEDTDGNGSGDSPLDNVTLTLLDSSGNPVNDESGNPITTTTDASGNYTFENVPVGTGYQVQETDPTGYTSSSDSEGFNDNLVTNIDVTAGQDTAGNDFVDSTPVTISGSVLSDENNNGTADNPLVGVVIELLDSSGNPVLDASGNAITATTIADGSYSFTNLPKGTYQLRQQTQPAGYTSTNDADGNATENIIVTVDATSGDVTGQDFEEVLTSVLPVTFLSLSATLERNNVILQWSTANEVNNDRYEIESSIDGNEFVKLGDVKGKGTATSISNYTYVDRSVPYRSSGRYYRIKQVDYNGDYDYSSILYISFKDVVQEYAVYPNPASTWLQVDVKEQSDMTLHDLQGRVVKKQTLYAGYNSINISDLSKGQYLIKVEGQKVKKIIKL